MFIIDPVARLIAPEREKYLDAYRRFQGIPTVERTPGGRLFAAFYSGGSGEDAENFVLLLTSDDDGFTWKTRFAVDLPETCVRTYDPCLWIDPDGALHLFWAQATSVAREGFNPTYDGRCGVWESVCKNPDGDVSPAAWSFPRRLANGVMMNKPLVTRDGVWLLPCAIWHFIPKMLFDLPDERFSNVYASYDHGVTYTLLGHSAYENRLIDEHMLVERRDGRLWMLIRARDGIGEAFSDDGGRTWTGERDTGWGGPCSRFHIRRLRSGRLLLVNHVNFTGRNNLTAQLSDDDGATWTDGLLLDGRTNVSYPDMCESADGRLYIIHDYDRYGAREILLSRVTEEDILAGALVSAGSYLRRLVNRAYGR